MPGACGLECNVCQFKEGCGGCVPGTDPAARERAEEIKRMMGAPCPVLECAIKSKIDYCLGCPDFPCRIHYYEIPFSKKLLDIFKDWKAGKYARS